MKNESADLILEIGSGISPMITQPRRIIYTDLSFNALSLLKKNGNGWHIVADGTMLPFKMNVFSHAVCSEVLEHIPDDKAVIKELARVIRPNGSLIVTFPHRKCYFSIDDRFVNHYRRYEISDMKTQLHENGFKFNHVQKLLGPLEKISMFVAVIVYSLMKKFNIRKKKTDNISRRNTSRFINLISFLFKWFNRAYMRIVMFDAKIMPCKLSTVLLIKCVLAEKFE